MGLLDGLMVLGILGGLGFVIYSRLAKKNPGIKKMTEGIGFKFIDEIPYVSPKPDKIEQVYNEKRTMM